MAMYKSDQKVPIKDENGKIIGTREVLNQKYVKNKEYSSGAGAGTVIGVVFLILLCFCFVRILNGRNIYTFGSFLEMLGNAKTIPLDWLEKLNTSFGTSTSSWPKAFSWLGNFFDLVISGVQFAIFLSLTFINLFPYLFYFLKFLLL